MDLKASSLKDDFTDNATLIADRLWRGSEEAAEAPVSVLRQHGVTHVLVCGFGLRPIHSDAFTYKTLPLVDLPVFSISSHLPNGVQFVDDALRNGGTVLVHCARGKSRSASILVAYLMSSRGISFAEAHSLVRSKRSISINDGFMKELKAYEKTLSKK